jgi:hypothetical protein
MVQASPIPATFAEATWDDVSPWYHELAQRPLEPTDAGAIKRWIADWSTLESTLFEAQANVAYSVDTGDTGREATHLRFTRGIGWRPTQGRRHFSITPLTPSTATVTRPKTVATGTTPSAKRSFPRIGRRLKRRKGLMSVDALLPWDVGYDPLGRPALRL